jgi:hypothetical protein
MVALGIIALFLSWGVPSVMRHLRKDPFRQTISDLVEACSHARARAILTGQPMQLVIRAEDGAITVEPLPEQEGQPETGAGHAGPPKPRPERKGDVLPPLNSHLADTVAVELLDVNFRDFMQQDEAQVRFFPNGTCDEFTVVLRSQDNVRAKISLDVVTSTAEVEDIR